MSRRGAYPILVAACALPRLVVLLHERAAVLEKNKKLGPDLARLYLKSGTFGYVPGVPSAYTQPLYGWFLIPIYWSPGTTGGRSGGAVAVAVWTTLVVYEIGRRFLSRGRR